MSDHDRCLKEVAARPHCARFRRDAVAETRPWKPGPGNPALEIRPWKPSLGSSAPEHHRGHDNPSRQLCRSGRQGRPPAGWKSAQTCDQVSSSAPPRAMSATMTVTVAARPIGPAPRFFSDRHWTPRPRANIAMARHTVWIQLSPVIANSGSSPNVRSAAMARKPRTNSGTIGGRLALTGAASVFVDTVPEEGSSGEPAPPSMLAAVLASAPASALASAPDPAPDPAPASAVVDCTFARDFASPRRTA